MAQSVITSRMCWQIILELNMVPVLKKGQHIRCTDMCMQNIILRPNSRRTYASINKTQCLHLPKSAKIWVAQNWTDLTLVDFCEIKFCIKLDSVLLEFDVDWEWFCTYFRLQHTYIFSCFLNCYSNSFLYFIRAFSKTMIFFHENSYDDNTLKNFLFQNKYLASAMGWRQARWLRTKWYPSIPHWECFNLLTKLQLLLIWYLT